MSTKKDEDVGNLRPRQNSEYLHEGSFSLAYSCTDVYKSVLVGPYRIGYIPWTVSMTLSTNQYVDEWYLEGAIHFDNNKAKYDWAVETYQTIRLVSRNKDVKDIVKGNNVTFNSKKTSYRYELIVTRDVDLINNYVGSGSNFTLEVTIGIKRVVEIGEYKIDFSKPTNMSDVVFVIEGKRAHANKSYLAMFSTVFEAMFFSGFKEGNDTEVELKDVKYSEFVELLCFLYPGVKLRIHEINTMYFLKLADRFDIEQVRHSCQKFLFKSGHFDNMQKFEMAEKYGLTALFNDTLQWMTQRDIEKLRASSMFKYFKVASKEAILDRLLSL